ncbi:hypothetical protein EMGBS15_04940 [Filimonas sp.]|jgi:hypothetical protein|nr:hypothetical protein EMGBS15_04940 [Filimonas sp.]
MTKARNDLKTFLDRKVKEYNNPRFIDGDPICVPHSFAKKQDIEISGFFAALIAWGNRTTIIQNANRIADAMDRSPHQFILQHEEKDLKCFLDIKHRTLNATDLLYLIHFLKLHYTQYDSLEDAFLLDTSSSTQERLIHFHNYVFSFEHPERTRKHISTPAKNSACKRLNMYLRWMVRKDKLGVDFGIWNRMDMKDLIIPMDVHVGNVAFRLGLIRENKANWKTATELTQKLKEFDAKDPCKYDFALFALGAEERVR